MALPARSVQAGALKVKISCEQKIVESTAISQRLTRLPAGRFMVKFALKSVKWLPIAIGRRIRAGKCYESLVT